MKKELQTFGAIFAIGTASLMAGSASAVTLPPTATVTVSGTTYDVTYFTGAYDTNSSRFTTTEMPWWNNSSLAQTFAAAVGTNLGLPASAIQGPSFAYNVLSTATTSLVRAYSHVSTLTANPSITDYGSGISAPYAIATPQTTAPVPAPLPIFGAAAAFGATKRLRAMSRRLQRSTTQIS